MVESYAPPQGLPIEAILPGTAYVIAGDALLATRQMAQVLKPYYGDFIQICDGVNDEVEIQAAIDAVYNLVIGKGRVILSEGDFIITANIIVRAYVSLEGQGREQTMFWAQGAAISNALEVHGHARIAHLGVTIRAGAGAPGARPNGIYTNSRTTIVLEDLYIAGDDSVADDGSDIRQCGICFIQGSASRIDSCFNSTNKRHGICIYQSYRNWITMNHCRYNTMDGIHIEGTSSVRNANYNVTIGNRSTDNDSDGIEIAGGANASKNIVVGNQLYPNTGLGLNDAGTNTEAGHNITV